MKLLMENWRQYLNEQNEIDAFKGNLSSIIEDLLLKLDIRSPMGQNGYNLKYFLDGNAEDDLAQYVEFVKIIPELRPIYDEMIEPLLVLTDKSIEYFESFVKIYEKEHFNERALIRLVDVIKDDYLMSRATITSRLWAGAANPDIIPFLKRFRDMLDIQESPEGIEEQLILEKCWPGYEKKGMKKMFGKMYPNCVKKSKKKKKKKKNEEIEDEAEVIEEKGASASYCKKTPCKKMGFTQKASCKSQGLKDCYSKNEGKDPAKGTGKKPKGSGRRLYTDEDPSDTVSVKFKTVQDIKDTLSKKSFKSKSHKRQSQIINLIHQRARAAYQNAKDPKVKARLKKSYDYAKKRKEASKEKTKRMNKKK